MGGGVFVGKGMPVGASAGGLVLTMGADGKLSGHLTLGVAYDVVPTWFEIAAERLTDAEVSEIARKAAWANDDDADVKWRTLEQEFSASMQCVMAVGIALDGLYSQLRPRVPSITVELIRTWQEKKTPRYAQVSEILRRAFNLKPTHAKSLRSFVKQVFELRDLAVHPHAEMRAPVRHPDLGVEIEGRFVYFSAANAKACVRSLRTILLKLTDASNPSNDVAAYMASLQDRIKPSVRDG